MDKEELQKNIALYYSKLPPKAQEVFSKMEWLAELEKISVKYVLSEAQKESLGTETTLLLLGIIHFVEYKENLTKELKLPQDSLEKIMTDIEESVLKDIRSELVEAFNKNTQPEIPVENQIKNSNIIQTTDPRLDTLPEGVLKIIEDSNYQNTLYEIAQEHKLSVTEMGSLDRVTTNLITGTIHPDEFKRALQKSMSLPEDETSKLVDEINDRIFRKIRQKLVGLDGNNFTEGPKPFAEAEEVKAKLPEEDLTVLKTHGIDIIPEKLEIEEGKKPEPHPIIAQKLSGPMQIPTIKSEHTTSVTPATIPAPAETPAVAPTPTTKKEPVSYTKNADPYREIPE